MYAPTPDGEIYILRGIPLDADYKHTLYFASSEAQYLYFVNKQKYWASHLMYIRETGRIRYNVSADMIEDCNYLMYRNQQYHDKWFYAFIKQVYYINDNCCEIEFEIDVMQTYLFDTELKESWIERNHTITDNIGDNIVDENLDIGGYESYNVYDLPQIGDTWSIIMYSTFDYPSFGPATGSVVKGVFSGLSRKEIGRLEITYDANYNPSASFVPGYDPTLVLQDIRNNHADKIDGIVALVMAPTYMETHGSIEWSFQPGNPSYFIKNNKLKTYPYHAIYITDGNGGGKAYRPEMFYGPNGCSFIINSDNAVSQSLILTPMYYKTNGTVLNFNESMIMGEFPQCSWTSNTYQTWLALNSNKRNVERASYSIDAGVGAASLYLSNGAEGLGSFKSGAFGILSMMADVKDRSKAAPVAHGTTTGSQFISVGEKTFRGYDMWPYLEYLRIIDDYFNMYGYAIHEVGIPNISSRPHWNYVKLREAIILPKDGTGLSASALKKIVSVYEHGITFWKNPSEVGNYSLDNRPA